MAFNNVQRLEPSHLDVIVARIYAGESVKDIAKSFKVAPYAVSRYLKHFKLSPIKLKKHAARLKRMGL